MKTNNVSEEEIRLVVSNGGFFPYDTPITNYPPDFVNGMLIAKWGGMYKKICESRAVPFE